MTVASTTSSRAGAALCGVYAFLLTFLALALFVELYGVDLPYWDEWIALPLYAKLQAGTFTWFDLWPPHNEHRIPVPRLAFVALYDLFGQWNLVAGMAFNALVMGVTVGVLGYTLARIRISPWIVAALVLILISPAQWDNILFGYQLLTYALTFGAVAAVCAVVLDHRLRWRTIGACIACCAISTGSMASGIGFWPAIAVTLVVRALLLAGSPRALLADRGLLARLAAFTVTAVAVVIVYFIGYPKWDAALHAPSIAIFIGWIARVLSSPMLDDAIHWPGILLSGILWLCVGAAVVGYVPRRRYPPYRDRLVLFAGIGMVLLANAAITGYGRGGSPSVPSRYTTTLFLNSILWLVAIADLGRWSLRRPAPAGLTAALALAAVTGTFLLVHADRFVDGLDIMRKQGPDRRAAKEALAFYLSDHSPGLPFSGFAVFPPPTRVAGDLGRPELTAVLPPDMLPPLAAPPVETDGDAWIVEGAWEGTAGLAPPAHWGSWRRGGPAAMGRIRVGPIPIDRPVLRVPIAGYVGDAGNALRIEDAADPRHWIAYAGAAPGDTWTTWNADVSEFVGREVVLVGVDAETQLPGWLAFGRPRPMHRALLIFELALSRAGLALQAVLLTGLAVLVVLAHARRRPPAIRAGAVVLASVVLLGGEALLGATWLLHESFASRQISSPAAPSP